jgi:hypothetical protein
MKVTIIFSEHNVQDTYGTIFAPLLHKNCNTHSAKILQEYSFLWGATNSPTFTKKLKKLSYGL